MRPPSKRVHAVRGGRSRGGGIASSIEPRFEGAYRGGVSGVGLVVEPAADQERFLHPIGCFDVVIEQGGGGASLVPEPGLELLGRDQAAETMRIRGVFQALSQVDEP